jgi:hypothetical protein
MPTGRPADDVELAAGRRLIVADLTGFDLRLALLAEPASTPVR